MTRFTLIEHIICYSTDLSSIKGRNNVFRIQRDLTTNKLQNSFTLSAQKVKHKAIVKSTRRKLAMRIARSD